MRIFYMFSTVQKVCCPVMIVVYDKSEKHVSSDDAERVNGGDQNAGHDRKGKEQKVG